jgi:hypothetical protein
MVYSMLGFYICEVAMGKKPKSGFPDSTHQELAEELRKEFPEARHLINFNVVKSKLTHSLKEDYDAFIACKQAPGFQYDPSKYEVSASDEVWARYVEVMSIPTVFLVIHSSIPCHSLSIQ